MNICTTKYIARTIAQSNLQFKLPERTVTNRSWILLCLSISIVYGFWCGIWSGQIGYNQAPDEVTHFFLIEYFWQFGTVPHPGIDPMQPFVGELTGQTFNSGMFWYYGLPFLHSLGAVSTAWLFGPLFGEGNGYLAARSFNWIMAAVFLFSQLQTASALLRRRGGEAIVVGLAVALIPQVTFVFSYMNSDGFGLACVSLMVWALAAAMEKGRVANYTALGAAIGLVILTKLYFYPAVLYVVIYIMGFWVLDPSRRNAKGLAGAITAAALISIPVIAVTYAYFGEFTGVRGQLDFVRLHQGDPATGYGTCYLACENAVVNSATLGPWLQTLWRSFFGVFGWMSIPLSQRVFDGVFIPITGLAIIGSIFAISISCLRRDWHSALTVALYWAMVLGTVLMSIISSQTTLPQAQGRYIFVAIPLAVLLIISIGKALRPQKGPRYA